MSVRNRRIMAAGTAQPRVMSILSGKGGVGKSVIAFNLAERLSTVGKALLVDADVFTGNAHILANVGCGYGWPEYCSGKLTFQEAVTVVTPSLHLLGSPKSPAIGEEPGSGDVARAIERLRRDARAYQHVIIDHPSGVSEAAIVIALASDLNMLVLLPELTSISDAYGLFKHLDSKSKTVTAGMLVNRCESPEEAGYIHQKFGAVTERFIGKAPEFLGHLSEDASWRQAVANQSAIAATAPESIAVKELNELSQHLINGAGRHQRPARPEPPATTNNQPAKADIRE